MQMSTWQTYSNCPVFTQFYAKHQKAIDRSTTPFKMLYHEKIEDKLLFDVGLTTLAPIAVKAAKLKASFGFLGAIALTIGTINFCNRFPAYPKQQKQLELNALTNKSKCPLSIKA